MSKQYKYIDNQYVEVPQPKIKWWQIVKKIALFIAPMILKNQKGIKGTPNENKVDKAFEEIEKL